MKNLYSVLIIGSMILFSGLLTDAAGQYQTPEWSKKANWYQIFPERFRNGDTANDPTAAYVGAPKSWRITPWIGDWYQRSFWEQRIGPRFSDFVEMRRYGGDLQGIIDKLSYLKKELDITAIHLTPVFEAHSYHKYDVAAYRHIDRFFGPNPTKDEQIMESEDPADPSTWKWTTADSLFLKLIKEAHKRNIKIVIEGMFNHTGREFWAFQNVLNNQRKSPYADWYEITSWDDTATADTNEFAYKKAVDHDKLPVFKKQNGVPVKPVQQHLFAITRRWMDPNGDGDPSDGVDGWLIDAPLQISMSFWNEWHKLVRDINPGVFTSANVRSNQPSKYVNKGPFNSILNYGFAEIVQQFLIDREISAKTFSQKLKQKREQFPDSAVYALQNVIDNHETPRLASMVVNPSREYDQNTLPEDGFKVRKPTYEEQKVKKQVALMQFMYIGSPLLYYGTETGVWGADAPHNRKPMVWQNMRFLDEVNHPFSEKRPRDENNFELNMFIFYVNLGNIRQANEVFLSGKYKTLVADDKRDVFVFARYKSDGSVGLVTINRTDKKQPVRINKTDLPIDQWKDKLYNPFTNAVKKLRSKEQFTLELPPMMGDIWIGFN